MATTKGLIRSQNRRGVRSDQSAPVTVRRSQPNDPSVCERCGSVFTKRMWRRGKPRTAAFLAEATWTVCPACKQTEGGTYYGRVRVLGTFVAPNEAAIRRRIFNVGTRAGVTQPQRRLVAVDPQGTGLEVLTTSQKLAHRIVRELTKAFQGRAVYRWSDDGTLLATWRRDEAAAKRR
jgi:NMD protein affecting ribosome stability and mRNA decay